MLLLAIQSQPILFLIYVIFMIMRVKHNVCVSDSLIARVKVIS
jgi:hypothetical protein